MARLKIVQQFDGQFSLEPIAQADLVAMLKSPAFLQQVSSTANCATVEFTGMLFQPMPYTSAQPKGMPAEFEQYYGSPDYCFVNVPPNFMFKAKIFQPSRLCAIYRQVSH